MTPEEVCKMVESSANTLAALLSLPCSIFVCMAPIWLVSSALLSTHVQLGIEAVKAGLHCLIEKLIASTAEESRPLLKCIEESDGVKGLIEQHR